MVVPLYLRIQFEGIQKVMQGNSIYTTARPWKKLSWGKVDDEKRTKRKQNVQVGLVWFVYEH